MNCLNRVLFGTVIDYLSTDCFDNCKTDKQLTIGNKKVKLSDIKKSTEKCINEFAAATNYTNEIKPLSVSTQKLDDGTIAGSVNCRSCYKDMPIFDTMSTHNEYSFKIADIMGPVCSFVDGDKVGQLMVSQTYKNYKTEKKLSEIISPLWAMKAVSKKLSGCLSNEAQSEELVYMPECVGNLKQTKNGNGTYKNDIIKLTPYWVVHFDNKWWRETFAVVNAVTENVDYINNSIAI